MLERFWTDLSLAWRSLRRTRAFSGAAVLTLAVGMAGATLMFAFVQGVLLRPLPVRDQDRIVVAWKQLPERGLDHWPFEQRIQPPDEPAPVVREIDEIRDATTTLESVAGLSYYGALSAVAVENGAGSYIRTAAVTGDFFDVLGVEPVLGRTLVAADDRLGTERVLVISEGLWQRRYGRSPAAIGRTLTIGGQPFRIVGVIPAGMELPRQVEAWGAASALASAAPDPIAAMATAEDFDVLARLRPGTTLAQAREELQQVTSQLELRDGSDALQSTVALRSLGEAIVGDVRLIITALFAAVGLVLLIASANAANLLLVRGEGRKPEFALRAALGAGRAAIARQVLAESLVLSSVAAILALTATWWVLEGIVALVPGGLPRADTIRLDAGVWLFVITLAILTAAAAGAVPALASRRLDLVAHLRGVRLTGAGSRFGRQALVVVQLALAVTVVAAAGLVTRSLANLESADMGFSTDALVVAPLTLPPAKYADRERHSLFFDAVTDRLRGATGIAGVTAVGVLPFSGTGGVELGEYTAEGQGPDQVARNPSLNLEPVDASYFDTFGVALVRGRAFSDRDTADGPAVAIVTEDLARRLWPGQDPIGRRLKFGGVDSEDDWRTVVGVATPTRYRDLRTRRSTLYLPAGQFVVRAQTLIVRTALPAGEVARMVAAHVSAVDSDVQVMPVSPFGALLDAPLATPRFSATLSSVFGIAALLLATIGLYAVIAGSVRQRYGEIGIRVALGATAHEIRALVLRDGLRLAVFGTGAGLAAAAGSMRFLRGLLFEVEPLDPFVLAGTALLLFICAGVASLIPAQRATRVDPMTLVRTDR